MVLLANLVQVNDSFANSIVSNGVFDSMAHLCRKNDITSSEKHTQKFMLLLVSIIRQGERIHYEHIFDIQFVVYHSILYLDNLTILENSLTSL